MKSTDKPIRGHYKKCELKSMELIEQKPLDYRPSKINWSSYKFN